MIPNHNTSSSASERPQSRPRFVPQGKDHLVVADWPIGLLTYQHPLKSDGGKTDYIVTTLKRSDGPDQQITRMAPAAVGLPTALDNDVFVALITHAKQTNFSSHILHFTSTDLFNILRWSPNSQSYQRLEDSLTRLRAVTIKYEYVWWDKVTHEVEPILITGILAEAKLVRRRGRKAKDAIPDSYIQWTNDLYQSIKNGNLTSLDLDTYFTLKRPGSRCLYRHLNKRWHGKHKHAPYERDLKELACGHLGMQDSKDLKRYFQAFVDELEMIGYLGSNSTAYIKVRPGTYRVRFQPLASTPTGRRTAKSTNTTMSPANDLVALFHRMWFKEGTTTPKQSEITFAQELIQQHDPEILTAIMSRLVDRLRGAFPDCQTFNGAHRYIEVLINEHHARKRDAAYHQQENESLRQQQQEDARVQKEEAERAAVLLTVWRQLSEQQQITIRDQLYDATDNAFSRSRIRKADLASPPAEFLDHLARQNNLPTISAT